MLTEQQVYLRSSSTRRHLERIICPTDLTPDSDDGLRYGVALARAYNAKLFVCHCVRPSHEWHGHIQGLGHIKGLFEESIGPHISVADSPALDWEGVVVEGDPAETVMREAIDRHADLIVMRSRRRPYAAALLGSVAETICRMAPCPVLVTHPREREWVSYSAGTINLARVLVAYDFSNDSELALSYALSLAQEFQSEMHLLHVLPARTESAWYQTSEDAFHQAMRRLQYAVPAETHAWCAVKQTVLEGQPYREILNYAEENNIDLICMGVHGAGFGMKALFGSNVDRVLRQAPCPVLIARPLKMT
jgi:nucleotide-binding universal stress UspA family protein